MRIAAGLNMALDVAGFAAGSQEIFEAIVVRFQVIISDAPILDGHFRIEEVPAIPLARAGSQF